MVMKIGTSFVLFLSLLAHVVDATSVFDISKYGAKGDGKTDIRPTLMNVWKEACASTTPTTILIPKTSYALNQIEFKGPCKAAINFEFQGTVRASSDISHFENNSPGLPGWITFAYINQLTVSGGGTFDGVGAQAWLKNNCQKTKNCIELPVSLVFNFVDNTRIRGITSLNSKAFHLQIFGSNNVTIEHVTITAPGDSPNTDGIHVGRSVGVNITDTTISTGDDCISIGDGTQQIHITKVSCGPGHGLSVGSLGRYEGEKEVVGIFVKNCTLTETTNGVRIKTWPASPKGAASDMHFEDIIMNNVANPVLIDQEYCPSNQCTKQHPSQVKISKVSFKNIRGTSSTQVAAKLLCSKGLPCENVEVGDINLTYKGVGGPAIANFTNVKPTFTGKQNPPFHAC
ncbi:unnamed protein product [Ilex paraguariensis]|uniref:Exopolygalacturonase-like n=1 Tax=Ilex paraguariensis TaxID=185542 RepID=A0ABC8QPT0_9AQUA